MTCWRCGRSVNNRYGILAPGAIGAHASWCSDGTPNDCTHCGGNPCRWWCEGEYDLPNAVLRSGWTRYGQRVLEPA